MNLKNRHRIYAVVDYCFILPCIRKKLPVAGSVDQRMQEHYPENKKEEKGNGYHDRRNQTETDRCGHRTCENL